MLAELDSIWRPKLDSRIYGQQLGLTLIALAARGLPGAQSLSFSLYLSLSLSLSLRPLSFLSHLQLIPEIDGSMRRTSSPIPAQSCFKQRLECEKLKIDGMN